MAPAPSQARAGLRLDALDALADACQPNAGGSVSSSSRGSTKAGRGNRAPMDALTCSCGTCSAPPELEALIARLEQQDPADRGVFSAVEGSVWALATCKSGSRLLQEVLDRNGDSQGKARLVTELKGNVNKAWQCELAALYGNFVVQKCVEVMPPGLCHFVRDEMLGGSAKEAACNKYGCRILQRLIEHFPNEDMEGLLKELLEERTLWSLMANKYGNFVVQCLLEHGSRMQRSLIAKVVLGQTEQNIEDEERIADKAKKMPEGLDKEYLRVGVLAANMYASNVIQKAMMHCSEDEQRQIVKKVLDAGKLQFLKRSRYGSFVTGEAQKLYERLFGSQGAEAA